MCFSPPPGVQKLGILIGRLKNKRRYDWWLIFTRLNRWNRWEEKIESVHAGLCAGAKRFQLYYRRRHRLTRE